MTLKPLQMGDRIDIIAPASRCPTHELRAAVSQLKAMGFRPYVPKDIFGPNRQALTANTIEVRIKHLKDALYKSDSKLIWCVRGGYGCLHLMPEIERWPKPKQAKILLGYSDITTLHAHFNQKWNWPTLHGPLLDRLGRSALSVREAQQLWALLTGQVSGWTFSQLKSVNRAAQATRVIRAPILGGNLTVLQSSLGTRSALRPKNCILYFEDLGEKPHRLDRMFTQMEQLGWFHSAKAVVLGDFLLNDKTDARRIWREVIPQMAARWRIPVMKGLPVGHSPARQMTLPLNTIATLKLAKGRGQLQVSSGIGPKES